MKGVTIVKIAPVSRDSRGEIRELFTGLLGRQVILYKRKEGAVFGRHFHKGIDPAKNPEYFFLISGQLELIAENGLTDEKKKFILNENNLLTIDKNIFHQMKALSDVVFIEHRSTVFDKKNLDCFKEKEYLPYLETLD